MTLLNLRALQPTLIKWANELRRLDAEFPAASIVVLLTVLVVMTSLIRWLRRRKLNVKILLADEIRSSSARALEYCYRPRELMLKGYDKYPDEVYGIDTRDGVKLVIPPRFLDDLKSHPSLSFKASIDNDMQVDYTYFGGPPEFVIHAIKAGMTASLPAYTPILNQMARTNMPRIMGNYKDWTSVNIHDRILKLVGTTNARVFLSQTASADEEWVDASTGYVLSVFDCIRALKEWPPWMRPFVYRFLPERTAIRKQWSKGRARVQECMQERKTKDGPLGGPPSMLDHLSSGKNSHMADDLEKQLLFQMTLVAVGTVTTFASTVQAVYDLVMHPEYISILRDEVESMPVDGNGMFTKEAIPAMQKLDSFIKESQRLAAADLSTFQRAATANMTLPDGTFVPEGTKLEANTYSIHYDDAHYKNASTFDGLRFYKQRQHPGHENKHLYISVGKGDLSFGYGRHACPGRYLGQLNIKLVMAELLRKYDLKAAGTQAPKSQAFEALVSPDADFQIMMKNRQV
ncbi:hypothetical protein G7Z17_g2137 [Cylindrodendrum hubeiense]|uniref:Cytochrome P450 monooxygenase n=1 Tax=Cylindrodendrum hubeiense TaxID=595255 RepID=A0A9P5HI51_9HYPO|nr:hypothetical protein G7Z17_g2137 [Cylindrodendrum hubeiense]